MAQLDKNLRAFVRFDGSGRIVPSSLILRKRKPKVGKWREIEANECCNLTTTTTTTSALCYCYVVSNPTRGDLYSEYTPCGETTPITITIPSMSTNGICSATPVDGESGLEITGGTFPCLNSGDCV